MGLLADSIQPLARKLFQLIREHNRLKKTSSAMKGHDQARRVRHSCHRHFCRFSKQLLDDNSINGITPNFSQQEAHEFFKKVYQPAWMPTPPSPNPGTEFVTDESGRTRFSQPSNALSPPLPHLLLTKSAISSSRDVHPFKLLSWTSSMPAGLSQSSQPNGSWQPSS